MKIKLPVVIALILLVALLGRCVGQSGTTTQTAASTLLPVTVLPAYEDRISDSVESLGTAIANESITITANVSEIISDIRFDDGQVVKKGDVIVLLAQEEEQAQLAAARAREQENIRELRRLRGLLQNRATSQREYDERVTLAEITRREIEAIQARINDRTLRAPFDGVLGIRRVSVGTLVQPGDPITTLDDISRIKLDFTVPSLYLASLRTGTPIEARAAGLDGLVVKGEIASVNSRIDPVTRSVLVRALLPNPNELIKPGLLMHVTLLRNHRTALVVAEESIIQLQNRHFVMVVNADNVVEERPVQIGARHPGMVEVVSGLDRGERVVVRGINTARAGQKVQIADTWQRIRRPQTGGAGVYDQVPAPMPDSDVPQSEGAQDRVPQDELRLEEKRQDGQWLGEQRLEELRLDEQRPDELRLEERKENEGVPNQQGQNTMPAENEGKQEVVQVGNKVAGGVLGGMARGSVLGGGSMGGDIAHSGILQDGATEGGVALGGVLGGGATGGDVMRGDVLGGGVLGGGAMEDDIAHSGILQDGATGGGVRRGDGLGGGATVGGVARGVVLGGGATGGAIVRGGVLQAVLRGVVAKVA